MHNNRLKHVVIWDRPAVQQTTSTTRGDAKVHPGAANISGKGFKKGTAKNDKKEMDEGALPIRVYEYSNMRFISSVLGPQKARRGVQNVDAYITKSHSVRRGLQYADGACTVAR